MVKIGILGGTYDPIHQGHISLAHHVYHNLNINTILFVPAADPPHKQNKIITPVHHRLEMVSLAIAGYPYFELSRVDIDREGPHYSVDMIRILRGKYNRSHNSRAGYLTVENTFFILGADSLIDLPTWHKPNHLLELCQLAVVNRTDYKPDLAQLTQILPELPKKIHWVSTPTLSISATDLRKKLAVGADVGDELTDSVKMYILEHGLYQKACSISYHPPGMFE